MFFFEDFSRFNLRIAGRGIDFISLKVLNDSNVASSDLVCLSNHPLFIHHITSSISIISCKIPGQMTPP